MSAVCRQCFSGSAKLANQTNPAAQRLPYLLINRNASRPRLYLEREAFRFGLKKRAALAQNGLVTWPFTPWNTSQDEDERQGIENSDATEALLVVLQTFGTGISHCNQYQSDNHGERVLQHIESLLAHFHEAFGSHINPLWREKVEYYTQHPLQVRRYKPQQTPFSVFVGEWLVARHTHESKNDADDKT